MAGANGACSTSMCTTGDIAQKGAGSIILTYARINPKIS